MAKTTIYQFFMPLQKTAILTTKEHFPRENRSEKKRKENEERYMKSSCR